MLVAAAQACHEANVNYQRDVLFIGQDIDPVVARMCYVAISLLGLSGYITIGNTLLMDTENWDYWYTPMYMANGFQWKQQREDAADTGVNATVPENVMEAD